MKSIKKIKNVTLHVYSYQFAKIFGTTKNIFDLFNFKTLTNHILVSDVVTKQSKIVIKKKLQDTRKIKYIIFSFSGNYLRYNKISHISNKSIHSHKSNKFKLKLSQDYKNFHSHLSMLYQFNSIICKLNSRIKKKKENRRNFIKILFLKTTKLEFNYKKKLILLSYYLIGSLIILVLEFDKLFYMLRHILINNELYVKFNFGKKYISFYLILAQTLLTNNKIFKIKGKLITLSETPYSFKKRNKIKYHLKLINNRYFFTNLKSGFEAMKKLKKKILTSKTIIHKYKKSIKLVNRKVQIKKDILFNYLSNFGFLSNPLKLSLLNNYKTTKFLTIFKNMTKKNSKLLALVSFYTIDELENYCEQMQTLKEINRDTIIKDSKILSNFNMFVLKKLIESNNTCTTCICKILFQSVLVSAYNKKTNNNRILLRVNKNINHYLSYKKQQSKIKLFNNLFAKKLAHHNSGYAGFKLKYLAIEFVSKILYQHEFKPIYVYANSVYFIPKYGYINYLYKYFVYK